MTVEGYKAHNSRDSAVHGFKLAASDGHGNAGREQTDNEDTGEDSELEIQRFIEECGGWGSDDEDSVYSDSDVSMLRAGDQANDTESRYHSDSAYSEEDANPYDTGNILQEEVANGLPGQSADKDHAGHHRDAAGNEELSYTLPLDSDGEEETDQEVVPFRINAPQDNTVNLLSKRLYVRKLFRRIPQISDTTSILVRSKAHVKGKVGCRAELAMGNSNKIKTTDTFEEPVYDGKPLYAGVYNGLSPLKHTKKRVFREIKVKIDWYAHSITHQIKNVVTFYQQLLKYIHPFQYQMLMTAIYEQYHIHRIKLPFKDLLDELNELKNVIITRAKNFNSKIFCVQKCRRAFSMAKAFIFEIDELYKGAEPYFDIYRKFATYFRKLPIINNNKPIIAIIGYTNVGKSSLFQKLCEEPMPIVKSIQVEEEKDTPFGLISDVLGLKWQENTIPAVKKSHAEVKIADYKFTTRSINLANVQYKVNNVVDEGQLLDTPGLLWRDKPKTNPYEKLTYATLKDLPAGVIFCFDLSDRSTLDDQLKLYRMLEKRFPHRPWINVISKGEDKQQLSHEGIKVVPHENLLENVYSMFATLDDIIKMQNPAQEE
ncbi:Nucleolar GTP-binding protein 1 (NOG1) domain- containing protein [Babesia divergens]|uniref:Nucleolar GTP-binding protein 1 (NOG1) domain-containing protein n=1 Tax=Babesia divergens TaxID=32595 RepID=A0AAD9G9J2_BABDI|nr:Nucleolar GTP-binding protein 1 (NOG1) domain- containing protein [Babesia divergens]